MGPSHSSLASGNWLNFSSSSSMTGTASGTGPASTAFNVWLNSPSSSNCLLIATRIAFTSFGGYICAARARPLIKFTCRCQVLLPELLQTPSKTSASLRLFVIQRVILYTRPLPYRSLDSICHRHIGPSTVYTLSSAARSLMHFSSQDFAPFGCSCKKYLPSSSCFLYPFTAVRRCFFPSFRRFSRNFGSTLFRASTKFWRFENGPHGGDPPRNSGFSVSIKFIKSSTCRSLLKSQYSPSALFVSRSTENPGLIPTSCAWAATRGGENISEITPSFRAFLKIAQRHPRFISLLSFPPAPDEASGPGGSAALSSCPSPLDEDASPPGFFFYFVLFREVLQLPLQVAFYHLSLLSSFAS